MTLTAVVASAGLVLTVSGCASGGDAAGDASSIRVQVETSKLPGLQAVVDLFEKANPDKKVNLETITSDQKATTNSLTLAAADAPDLGVAPINANSYQQLLEGDALLPLDDVWEAANLNELYSPDVVSTLTTADGKPYSALFESTIYNTVYYNADLFDELGITPPTDHAVQSDDELFAIADKLKAGGHDALCIGGSSNYQLGWLLDGQLAALATPDELAAFNSAATEEGVDFTSKPFVDSLQQIQDWYDDGLFQAGVLGQNFDTALANFSASTCGMILGGATTTTALEANAVDYSYDWFTLPSANGATLPTRYAGSTFVIPKTAKNPELAKEFLEFFYTPEASLAYVGANGSLPAINGLPEDKLQEVLPPIVNSILAAIDADGAGTGWTSVVPGALGQGFIDPEIQKQLNGQQTPAQTAENQQKNYEAFLSSK
ncbi:extracellular solute-binding protein [Compostimonas suwonensis]|uniref:ABC transporter substrate-binding protein n=1 Tax=Compostimonas suwonensis TaxID=1048394 RepID=UPI0012FD0A37|nr:extracellular solute-binding protein [Compostimonas suwonensis]